MKCVTCDDGRIRSISYVVMQVLFSYEIGRELETLTRQEYAVVGYEEEGSFDNSWHILFSSCEFDECAEKFAKYLHELNNFPDDDSDEPDELPKIVDTHVEDLVNNVIVQIKELKEIIDYYKCSCSAQKQRIDELYTQLHRYQEDKPEELPFG